MKKEPITVVAAVALNMDRQWEPVFSELNALVHRAAKENKDLLHKGRSLKGKDLYSGVRRGIGPADTILRAALRVVADHGLSVFYSAVDRAEFENYRGILKMTERDKKMTPFDKAFEGCFSVVDRTVRTETNEQILWIADRSDRARESATKNALIYHRFKEATFGDGGLIFGQLNVPLKTGASRIADIVYFGSSDESVGLQLADVCCSTITRHLLEQGYGRAPVAGPYYEMLRPAIRNHGTPVMFPPLNQRAIIGD